MEFKDCLQYLLDNKHVVILGNKPIVTTSFEEEVLKILINTPTQKEQTIDGLTLKELWNKFIVDAAIQHRVTSPQGGTYTIRHYTDGAAKKLKSIVLDKTIDYKKLVVATKHYYRVTSYKKTLQNYLLQDIWKGEYDTYTEGALVGNDGGDKFED